MNKILDMDKINEIVDRYDEQMRIAKVKYSGREYFKKYSKTDADDFVKAMSEAREELVQSLSNMLSMRL